MRVLALLALVLMPLLPIVVEAQTGHSPANSPYRDIVFGHSVLVNAGQFGGGGGRLSLGPHDGTVYGLRYDIRVSGPIQFGFSVANGTLERLIQDPDDSVATRTSGPVSQTVTFAELAIQFNLTGSKTWRGLAPYVAGSGGLALGGTVSADTTGYEFGNKFYLVPAVGLRFFLTRSIHLRAEARSVFWKLSYPISFGEEPAEEPGTAANPNALIPDRRLEEWTSSRWLLIGLGVSFSL